MCSVNVTPSVSEDIVQRAREVARQQGTSLNATAHRCLESVAGVRHGDLAAQLGEQWRERSGCSGGWRFNREELYEDRLGPRQR